jgi:hypothetical protein
MVSLLADRNRMWALPLAALALLVPMGLWTWLCLTVPVGYKACLEDPTAADGREVLLSLFTVGEVVDDQHFVAMKGSWVVPVEGDTEGLVPGQDVSVSGRFRASDLQLVQVWREAHHDRPMKRVLGVAGLLFVAGGLPVWFTVQGRRVVERA